MTVALEGPQRLHATAPPEADGRSRDDVRLLVASRHDGSLTHARFRDLPEHLEPGDLLVVNTSGTLPAALTALRDDGSRLHVHVSTRAPHDDSGDLWVVELRTPGGADPLGDGRAGERLHLPGDAALELVKPYDEHGRLWIAHVMAETWLPTLLSEHGTPIRYDYVPESWPIEDYQTVFALHPGSAEMPSAARPFTPELVTHLVAGGVLFAPILLHTGVSSPERHEEPYAEYFEVSAATTRTIDAVQDWGGRVIAVGTTVVRAIESVADDAGYLTPQAGWTNRIIDAERPPRVIDGLITGWHEPEASHLHMLEAIAGPELLQASYLEALAHGYHWHEFGDSHLILP